MSDLAQLSAHRLAAKIAAGEISALDAITACLAVINQRDQTIKAWNYLDQDRALEQALAADAHRDAGYPLGPLHGVPVGIKDIFDTADMPTENGTVLDAGRRPVEDSAAVSRIRQAGGIIMGKTVTTELAVFSPGVTTNPLDPKRTPGGSSSGSAAAVAANMVPVSIGSQTTGSTLRPASFCGVFGFKPTHGLVSRAGALVQSPPLDTVGYFARSLKDLALLGDCLVGYDPRDKDTIIYGPANLMAALGQNLPLDPTFAFVKSPVWGKADKMTKNAFGELTEFLGGLCEETDLPDRFNNVHDWHRCVMVADFARNFDSYYSRGKDQISEILCGLIEEGQKVLAVDYNSALQQREKLSADLDEIFSRHDAILTPSAVGEATMGLETTGDPSFCTIWTFCGLPAVNLPVFEGWNGMPIGLQMVGPRGHDARLLRHAQWLVNKLREDRE